MKVGIDSEQISRMSQKLLNRIATPNEIEYVGKFRHAKPHIASLWTAKEATIKALGKSDISFLDIEILHDENGKPSVALHGKAKQQFASMGLTEIEISITHNRHFATSIVLMQ